MLMDTPVELSQVALTSQGMARDVLGRSSQPCHQPIAVVTAVACGKRLLPTLRIVTVIGRQDGFGFRVQAPDLANPDLGR